MLQTKDLFALEYNFRQRIWRINNLEETLAYNIGWFAKGEDKNDYRILAISKSREQLREFKKSLVEQKEKIA